MVEVHQLTIGSTLDQKLAFAVICSQHQSHWLFVRHKQRDTWEVPGGHREPGEPIEQTAARELVEETGARKFSLVPVCDYSVQNDGNEPTFGRVFFAQVESLGELPPSEIAEVIQRDRMPEQMTYPHIQPLLYGWVKDFLQTT
jgi:8-oxo-dGTP diphosphatase